MPPTTTKALFSFFYLKEMETLKTAIKIVRQSVIVSLHIAKQTLTIIATDATFTASKKAENSSDVRTFFTARPSNATKTKDGRKIPMVETTAPVKPLI